MIIKEIERYTADYKHNGRCSTGHEHQEDDVFACLHFKSTLLCALICGHLGNLSNDRVRSRFNYSKCVISDNFILTKLPMAIPSPSTHKDPFNAT